MIGENIRRLRKENKISQEELAEKIGVSRQSISLWENGQTQPTIENVIVIANVFGVSTDDILKTKVVEGENIIEDVDIEVMPTKKYLWKFKLIYLLIFISIVAISLIFYITGNKDNKFEELSDSVLMLNVYGINNELLATGSGFIVFENDILVTNYHVIEDGCKIEAIGENDVVYSLDKVVAFNEEKDLAILKFSSPTDLKVLTLHNSSKISKGDDVIAIGSPIGLKNTVSKGIISSIREDKDIEILQITAPISSESSGGALLNEKGKIIGVTFAGIDDGQNLNFAIPSNYIGEVFESRSDELDIESFYYEQNPIEKYKLICEEVKLNDIFEHPGKYHHKDICVSGLVSLFDGRMGYIVEDISMISYDSDYDFNLSEKKENRILRFRNDNDEMGVINEKIQVGDYITIYGNLFDQRIYSSKWNYDSYGREFGKPKAIEIN